LRTTVRSSFYSNRACDNLPATTHQYNCPGFLNMNTAKYVDTETGLLSTRLHYARQHVHTSAVSFMMGPGLTPLAPIRIARGAGGGTRTKPPPHTEPPVPL